MTLSKIGIVAGACVLVVFAGCEPVDDGIAPTPDGSTPGADAASGADAGATEAGCDFGEPNDAIVQATRIDLNRTYAGLCVSNDDQTDSVDAFEIVTPEEPAGGVVEVVISNVRDDGNANVIVSGVDGETIVEASTLDANGGVSGWFTASPSSKYHVQVLRTGGPGKRFAYDLRVAYTSISDTFEPNNSKEQAKTIEINKPIEASPAAPSENAALAPGDDQDWYKIDLAGSATIKMTGNPPDFRCDVELLDATGEPIGEAYNNDAPGADCVLEATDLPSGTYFINAHSFGGVERAKPNAAVAPYVLGHYKLEVVQ